MLGAVLCVATLLSAQTAPTFADLPGSYFFSNGGQNIGSYYAGYTFGPNVSALSVSRFGGYSSAAYPPHSGDVAIWDPYDPAITIAFATPVQSVGVWYASLGTITLQAYDKNNAAAGSSTGNPNTDGVSGTASLLSVSGAAISSVKISGVPGTFVLSSLTLNGTGAPPAPREPTATLTLPATGNCATDFYIAEATLAPGAKQGYWGMEVKLSQEPRELRGGFNLGGGFDGGGMNPGFGAFSLSSSQRVTFSIYAQSLGGPIALVVDLLKDNTSYVTGIQGTPGATTPLTFFADLTPGFYVVRINSTASSDRGAFQLALGTQGSFAGGVVVGGYLTRDSGGNSLSGFGAFCVPQTQGVTVSLYGESLYGANAVGDLVLTMRDYQRNVIGVYKTEIHPKY